MGKLIRKEEALGKKVFSRDLREFVVPVREINQLLEFEEPEKRSGEQSEDYKDMIRMMFNRCYATTVMSDGAVLCGFCGMRKSCDEMRSTGKESVKSDADKG